MTAYPMPGANHTHLLRVADVDVPMRELYMRLYRSWWEQDEYYHAAFCEPVVIEQMHEMGHVEPVGEGWRITEAGLQAWARLNEDLMRTFKRSAFEKEMFDPLWQRIGVERRSREPMKANTDKRELVRLTPTQRQILEILANGQGAVLPRHLMGKAVGWLLQAGLVQRVEMGQWRITDEGRMRLGVAAKLGGVKREVDMSAKSDDAPLYPYTDEAPEERHPTHALPKNGTGEEERQLMPGLDCKCAEGCVNKRVLDLIVASYPEVGELRDILLRQEEILKMIQVRK